MTDHTDTRETDAPHRPAGRDRRAERHAERRTRSVGVGRVVFAFTISLLSAKNLMSMDVKLLQDLALLAPIVAGFVTYAVLKTIREGHMYDLNRRYYRLRPPK